MNLLDRETYTDLDPALLERRELGEAIGSAAFRASGAKSTEYAAR